MTDLAAIVLDTSIKMILVGLLAWIATARAGLHQGHRAHLVWLSTLAGFVLVPIGVLVASPATSIVPSSALRGAAPAPSAWIVAWLLWGYLAVAGALLLRVAAGLVGVRRLIGRAIAIDPGDADPVAASLAHVCALGRARLVESAALSIPATAGFVRPRVLLPAGWREMDAEALRAAVRHELAHVKRLDYLVVVLTEVLRAVWWFHPVVWVGTRRVRWFAELACDAEAAGGGGHDAYARALLLIAKTVGPRDRRGPAFVLTATSGLARRIELLLERSHVGRWQRRAAATIALALLPALLFVRFGLSAPPAPDTHAAQHAVRHSAHGH